MDDLMVFGCSGFVFSSLFIWLLTVWPFLLFNRADRLHNLVMACAIGFAPAILVGAICSRRFGLPGACGFLASALSTAVFIYLRISQMFLAAQARQIPKPDYPQLMETLLPAAWVVLVLLLAVGCLPKAEIKDLESIGRS
jgi:hypothetical protein